MRVFDVILRNEGGDSECLYDVAAADPQAAVCEAWRRYRELPFVDSEYPPPWTLPRLGEALERHNGERPFYGPVDSAARFPGLERDVIGAGHCHPV